ncbi:MAG: RluA family pseudouridine synthase [Mediterranea sp.]|jgi:tRNA pseudouridine32 synthase/23S rRNA pseudouridine746 synthase|nr:RluA family pseudouridine synthase [Mediterranea sp.]
MYIHPLSSSSVSLPQKFTNPFGYIPHPLCLEAAAAVQHYLEEQTVWHDELQQGKMFGVLAVQAPTGEVGFLAAFSGTLGGSNRHDYFVPPVYDLLRSDGYFRREEARITAINRQIRQLEEDAHYICLREAYNDSVQKGQAELAEALSALKAAKTLRDIRRQSCCLATSEEADMIRESQHQKASYKRLERLHRERTDAAQAAVEVWNIRIRTLKHERKQRSASLQQWLFEQFKLLNYRGEVKDLCQLFADTVHRTPPAGAGECAVPKLLQYAYLNDLKPVAMAEFWWGNSPVNELRRHGYFYPACKGKCEPILKHMLQGLDVEKCVLSTASQGVHRPHVVYEDEALLVVAKPAGMLSVPGKGLSLSLYEYLCADYPHVKSLMMAHRLDMDTSGLVIVAKGAQVYKHLQRQFSRHTLTKRYVALLNGVVESDEGVISLPLSPDRLDMPRQRVDFAHGKHSVTRYEVLERKESSTRVAFYPQTGRTHQLRVHAAHPQGLNAPIVGDPLYGTRADRMYLHAEMIEFVHPLTGKTIRVELPADE